MDDAGAPRFASGEIRDRLANERTLLAWLRTALGLMAVGVAIGKFGLFLELAAIEAGPALPPGRLPDPTGSYFAGVGLILLGGIVAALGGWRTRVYARFIDPEGKSPSNAMLAVLTALTVATSLALALYVDHPSW